MSANLAMHLAANIHHIAKHETAGACHQEIHHAIDQIERAINRPQPPRFLGPCRTPTDQSHDKHCQQQHPHPCGIALTAKIGDTETQCPQCHTTYNINRLLQQQIDDTNDMSFTLTQLYKTILPINHEYIPLRTLQHWIAHGRLVPTGHDHTGEPRYLLADVRELRDNKPQHTPTGGAAHKRPA